MLFTVCTPVGFSRMFTVMGELIAKPKVGCKLIVLLILIEGFHL